MADTDTDKQAVTFPNLTGRWVGFLNSSYKQDGQNMIVPLTLEIKATDASLTVRACFEKAESESLIAGLEMINGRPHLCYMYDNTINSKAHGSSVVSPHRGGVILEYLEKDDKRVLKGRYFNDLAPVPNHGEIKVAQVS